MSAVRTGIMHRATAAVALAAALAAMCAHGTGTASAKSHPR